VQNQNESDIDCGGTCGPTCQTGQKCLGGADCVSNNCQAGVCAAFACNGPGEFPSADNTHCYRLVTTGKTWANALLDCQAWGGSLVSITSSTEESLVQSRAGSYAPWIGFNDLAVEGTFVWSNGDAVTYTHWNGGQPDDFHSSEDCAQMRSDGYWNDLNCTGTRAYVCER
jgi:hypothetical protein